MLKVKLVNCLMAITLSVLLLGFPVLQASGKKNQVEPIELLIDFKISGKAVGVTSTGIPIFTVGRPGYAPKKIFKTGEISDKIKQNRQVTELKGAKITFSGSPTDPVVKFTCLPGSCTMTFADGSVLTSDAGVPLTGRAINFWGPVVNSPDL